MAIQSRTEREGEGPEPATIARYLRVKVVDHTREGRPAVNVRIPVGLVKWGMKMAQAFNPKMREADLDWDTIMAAIQEKPAGEIVHVEDEAEHKTIDVWME